MTLVRAVQRAFDRLAPTSLAGSWDNVGTLLEAANPNPSHRKVLLTIDFTTQVREAMPSDTGVVVSYHPPLFAAIKSLRLDNPLQANLLHCAARGISVYSPHSSLDAANGGIDDWLADGLERGAKRRRITPASTPPEGHENAGSGMIVSLSSPATLDELVSRLKPHLGVKNRAYAEIILS